MDNNREAEASRRMVHDFLFCLGEGNDVDGWLALLAPDVTVDTPFAPPGAPTHFAGRDEIDHRFGDARRPMPSLKFLDIEVLGTEDPTRWIATCRSEGVLPDGSRYKNRYCWDFRIRGGKITGWTEYYNPLELMAVSQEFRPDC